MTAAERNENCQPGSVCAVFHRFTRVHTVPNHPASSGHIHTWHGRGGAEAIVAAVPAAIVVVVVVATTEMENE